MTIKLQLDPNPDEAGKGPTRLKHLALKRAAGETTRVDIDVNTGVTFGPNADEFNRYLGVVSRERLSILINSWDDVSEVNRNMHWEDVWALQENNTLVTEFSDRK